MPTHDFTRLSSYDFEELACDLLQSEWATRLELFTAGRDSGIDIRGYVDTGREVIVQCKHAPGSTFAKLLSLLKREELPKLQKLKPKRYVLVTSVGLTPANKKTLVALCRPYLKRQSDVIGKSEVNTLLRRHRRIETSNFKLWLTSIEVMQRVLHNAELCQTEFEVDRVSRKLPLFVQNDAFPRAQKILNESRIVVISGVPGIGKTTLADMLLYAHLEQDYEPVVIQENVAEAKRLFVAAKQQIFYFDDFLGQTFLHDRPDLITGNQDAALVSFMEGVRASKNSRFILTTREHILQKALSVSEKIASSPILDNRCILELSDYTFGQKARILYNHLYFSDLPSTYKEAVVQGHFYFQVIRHQNFNPRLIEWLSGYTRVKNVTPANYRDHITALLESPERIWEHAFNEQISESARSVLFCLGVSGYGTEIRDLEVAWQALHQHKARKYNFVTSPRDFRRALADLEGSFIKIELHRVQFLNPSIRDFIENLYRGNREHVIDVIESATAFRQIDAFRDLAEERSSPELDQVLAPSSVVVVALARVMDHPHIRWSIAQDGKYTGTYLDTIPEHRVRALVKWAESSKSPDLLSLIDKAVANLERHWQQFTIDMVPTIGILETLEASAWVLENGGVSLHRKLFDRIQAGLHSANTYEWRGMLAYRRKSKTWVESDYASVREALREYRLRGVMENMPNVAMSRSLRD